MHSLPKEESHWLYELVLLLKKRKQQIRKDIHLCLKQQVYPLQETLTDAIHVPNTKMQNTGCVLNIENKRPKNNHL